MDRERGRDRRVLVTDDFRDSADALAERLRLDGFEVYTAYCGTEAIAVAERVRPEAALLDIAMPDLDGYEVVRRLRQTSWGPRAQLIAISAFDTPDHLRRSQSAGFDYHLVKPVDFATLRALLVDPQD
jgi:CheY-like chemotaxis protein